MKPTSLLLAILASSSSVLATTTITATISTTPCTITKSTLTTLATITVGPAATVEDRAVAEAEMAEKGKKKATEIGGDVDNCMSTSYKEYKGAVITITEPYLKGCKQHPTGVGAVQNVGFHG